jgi:hypothetical protein
VIIALELAFFAMVSTGLVESTGGKFVTPYDFMPEYCLDLELDPVT